MTTTLQLKKLLIIPLLFLVGNVWGQTTYTGIPSASGAICPTATEYCSSTAYYGNIIKANVQTVSGNSITFRVRKCDGSSFGSSGTLKVMNNTICGTQASSIAITSGGTFKDISINVSHIGTINYRIVLLTTSTFYTNELSVTGTQLQPDLYSINESIAPGSSLPGGSVSFANQVQNIGTGNASSSTIGYYLSNSSTLSTSSATYLGQSSVPSLAAGQTSSFINSNITIPTSVSPGNYYLCFKADNGNSITESNESNNSSCQPFTVLAPTPPSLQVESCFATNSSAFNVGEIMNGSVAVRNTPSSQSWTGTITIFMKHTVSGTTNNLVNQNFTIPGGNSQTIYFNNIAMNYPTGSYKLYCQYTNSPNGGIDFIKNNGICSTSENTSTGTITPTKLITITSSPNLVCGTSIITPVSPVVGQSANFKYTISNTGTGNYTGTLQMWIRNTTTVGVPLTGMSISGLLAGNSHTFDYTSSGITFAPGSYLLQIEDASGTPVVKCSVPFTVVADPTACVTWTDTPPTGDKLTAANYLACNHIIQASQSATENRDNGIKRELMAKVTFNSLYKDVTLTNPQPPAQYYPVPFTDMQGTPAWLKEVKTLAYLQWSDDITPFDRDFINFRPDDHLPKKYALKVILEAFNIPKSTATPSPFSDVSTSEAMYGYIKKAHELGLISGTVFNVDSNGFANVNITREDLFVVLWKLLTNPSINKPTVASLNNPSNYYVPGNNRMATMGKVPDIDQANFNHYQKTSFSIAGRGVSLDFTHTYNSFLTELPKGYFEEDNTTSSQKFTPLGIGWTHTYNIYAQKVAGYTFGTDVEPDKLMVYYPDGSINTFNYATGVPDGIEVYDTMSKVAITGGERITILTKGQVSYVFENFNNGKFYFIKSIKDRNNNGVKCSYEASSTIPSVAKYHLKTVQEEFNDNSLGRSLTFGYASVISPYITSVTESGLGRVIHFNVDTSTKSLTDFTDAKSQVTHYVYDDATNYNKSNLLTEIWLPKGNKIRNTYAQRKLISSQTLNTSSVTTSTTAVNWTPNYTASGYNSSSTVISQQSAYNPNVADRTTTYTHNTIGNPTQIVSPTGTTTFNSYDTGNNANLPTSLTVNGQSSSISYDAKGNVLNISKNGITNIFTYTPKNDVDLHTDGRGFVTNYDYDTNGNLEYIRRPTGFGYTQIYRNSYGQVIDVYNPSNIQTHFGYNVNGLTNLVSSPQVAGVQTTSEYDNASRLKKTIDAMNNETRFDYDANDNVVDTWDANNQNTHHLYDQNDNHTDIRNPKLEHQVNTYNPDDDMLASETFGSHVKSYTYNEDGSLKTHTRGNGTFTYSYLPNGRLQSDTQTSYTYYTNGNINTITNSNGTLTLHYDANDRLDYYDDYFGNRVSYTYDANNNIKTIVYPGSKTVTYTYDAVNRCTDVLDWNNKNTHYDYLADDRVDRITLPNTSYAQYSYDPAGRPTGIANKKADGTIISAYTFGLRPDGNHETETITEPSIVAGLATITPQTVSYGLYPNNIIQSQGSTNFTNYTSGSIQTKGTDSFTYDLNDNMLTAPNSTFSYDGAGNRRAKTVSGVNTRYVLSILGMSQVLMETNSSNAVQNYYVYGPTGLLYRVKTDNTTYSYYHYDYRGSTTAITNDAQNVTHSYSYDPFGKVLAKTEADANPFQYVGQHGVQYESPTLTFMRARYYDPTTGRFVSEDPIWALNLYPYADNNPINKIDKDGKIAGWIIEIGVGATLGALFEGGSAYLDGERGTDLAKTALWGATKGAANSAISLFTGKSAVKTFLIGIFSALGTQIADDYRDYKKKGIVDNFEERTVKYTTTALRGAISGLLSIASTNTTIATQMFGKTGALSRLDMRRMTYALKGLMNGVINEITSKFVEKVVTREKLIK